MADQSPHPTDDFRRRPAIAGSFGTFVFRVVAGTIGWFGGFFAAALLDGLIGRWALLSVPILMGTVVGLSGVLVGDTTLSLAKGAAIGVVASTAGGGAGLALFEYTPFSNLNGWPTLVLFVTMTAAAATAVCLPGT